MALPALKSLEDCADFSKVVEPFLPQLYELPSNVLSTVRNGESLLNLYANTNPLVSGFAFSIFIGGIFWVASEANRNFSQVDRFWSLLPAFYNAHFAAWAHLNNLPSQRVELVLFWSVVWSVCLLCQLASSLYSLILIFKGSIDFQLLAQRRLRDWLRRL